ncbi:MAG: ribosomal RNA small subunit methyltransferase E [Hyphobacterium sp.]|nr:MAG: ribosomal RNA small subunit methyltransferase E [Hyphobacterium sp.]
MSIGANCPETFESGKRVDVAGAGAYRHFMSDPRLYCEHSLSDGASVSPSREESHYLVSVMRRKIGDKVIFFNAKDGEWSARIVTADRKTVTLTVETLQRAPQSVPDLELLFAPVKKSRTDFIVEKATELGVRHIRPVLTRRTIVDKVRIDRLSALAREAAEQTERFDLPKISEAEKLDAVLRDWPNDRMLIFCDEAGDAMPMLEALRDRATSKAAILIGPEGGFTTEERAQIRALPVTLPVSLGPRILRADTAAAAALTIWQSVCGDWTGGAQPRE